MEVVLRAAFTWAGIFKTPSNDYVWIAQKVNGRYVDPSMRMVAMPADSATETKLASLANAAAESLTAQCEQVPAGGTIVPNIDLVKQSVGGGRMPLCYQLMFDDAMPTSTFKVQKLNNAPSIAFFTEHVPTEFINFVDVPHYFMDRNGVYIAPEALLGDSPHKKQDGELVPCTDMFDLVADGNHGHGHRLLQTATATATVAATTTATVTAIASSTSPSSGCDYQQCASGVGVCGVCGVLAKATSNLQGSTQFDPRLNMEIAYRETSAVVILIGPNDGWYAVGFDAQRMSDQPYTIVVGVDGTVTERRLGSFSAGVGLNSTQIKVLSSSFDAAVGGWRIMEMELPLNGWHYSFEQSAHVLNVIWAIGRGAEFGYHATRGAGEISIAPGGEDHHGRLLQLATARPNRGTTMMGQVTVSSGHRCSTNTDCRSGICRIQGMLGAANSVACAGVCIELQPDGTRLPRLRSPTSAARPSWYDYSECEAKEGKCGVCGQLMSKDAPCSETADCGDGLCCQMRGTSEACQGTCVKISPNTCPKEAKEELNWLQKAFNFIKDVATDVATCVADVAKDEAVKYLPNVPDEYGCRMAASLREKTLELKCGALDPEKGRRLAAVDASGGWARRFGYGSPQEAQSAGYSGYILGRRPAWMRNTRPPYRTGRSLLGFGSASAPETYRLACAESETSRCKGGAAFSVFAEIDFKPLVSIKGDLDDLMIEVELSGELRGSVGVGLTAAGACEETKTWMYPAHPKPVATYCFYTICVTVLIQGQLDLTLKGTLAAQAQAEYHTVYGISGTSKLELNTAKLDQFASSDFIVSKKSEWWNIGADGYMDAIASATVGPVITFLLVPGAFATIFPYVTSEASLYGAMRYDRQSSANQASPQEVPWPTEVLCNGSTNSNDSNASSTNNKALSDDSPDGRSHRRRSADTTKNSTQTQGSFVNATGLGFTVAASDLGKSVTDDDMCLAAGLALVPGYVVSGGGPPPGFGSLDVVFTAICADMTSSITANTPGATLLGGSIDCMGKAITGDDSFSVLSGAQKLCESIISLIPQEGDDSITFASDEWCTDIWGEYVGPPACACNVGCNRRHDDAMCNVSTGRRAPVPSTTTTTPDPSIVLDKPADSDTIKVTLLIYGLDFDALEQDAALRSTFVTTLQALYAAAAKVDTKQVSVIISKGGQLVTVTITASVGLALDESANLPEAADVLDTVKEVRDIETATEHGKTIAEIAVSPPKAVLWKAGETIGSVTSIGSPRSSTTPIMHTSAAASGLIRIGLVPMFVFFTPLP